MMTAEEIQNYPAKTQFFVEELLAGEDA